MDTGIFSDNLDGSVIAIFDEDIDKPFSFQGGDHILNLAFADAEELRKIAVGGITTALVVERMDFDKQDLFHD